jgi:hypothetical protein
LPLIQLIVLMKVDPKYREEKSHGRRNRNR